MELQDFNRKLVFSKKLNDVFVISTFRRNLAYSKNSARFLAGRKMTEYSLLSTR
jgi:hypothetical protein